MKPVAASRVWQRAPARAMTRGSPKRSAGVLRPPIGGGVRDPLKGWARKDGALACTSGLQYAPVGGAGFGLQFIEVGQPGQWEP